MRLSALLPALALPAILALPACHLVDQRDFNRSAGLPPVPPRAPVKPAPVLPALLTIRFTEPDPPYQHDLALVVREALNRKPDARFTVLTSVPQGATAAETADRAALAESRGRAVAQTIVSAGALPAQIEQQVAASPATSVTEIRVMVR